MEEEADFQKIQVRGDGHLHLQTTAAHGRAALFFDFISRPTTARITLVYAATFSLPGRLLTFIRESNALLAVLD